MNKIFCLGLHKTATLSLSHALTKLGFECRHGYKKQSDWIAKDLHAGRDGLETLEERLGTHDAYLDLYTVRFNFAELDHNYPDSKFILTTRDEDEWVRSVRSQISKRPDSPFYHYWYFQTPGQWRWDKRASENSIREYFTGRDDDFLEMDITANSSPKNWGMVCKFLDKQIPHDDFPHANKTPEKHK